MIRTVVTWALGLYLSLGVANAARRELGAPWNRVDFSGSIEAAEKALGFADERCEFSHRVADVCVSVNTRGKSRVVLIMTFKTLDDASTRLGWGSPDKKTEQGMATWFLDFGPHHFK